MATVRTPDQHAALGRVFELLARAYERVQSKSPRRVNGRGGGAPQKVNSHGIPKPIT